MAASKSALITVMEKAARRAARGLLRDFGEVENLQVSRKGPADFVSQADLQAERILREDLAKARPTFGMLMEESGATAGSDVRNRWVVDPLDGTTNFLHGLPHFCISIAVERDGEIIAGVVYNPVPDEFYWADKGGGAFLNDRRLRVSARQDFADGLFATGAPFKGHGQHKLFLAEAEAVMAASSGIRRAGSAALDLAYVAAGRYDGYWEHDLKVWDVAAGLLLVREAGGLVSDLAGRSKPLWKDGVQCPEIVAANDRLHQDLARRVKEAGRPLLQEQKSAAAG